MTYRVVQWSTGSVGKFVLRGIIEHPDLELVGVQVWSPDKIGKDAAELCGLDTPTGVLATDDVDALLALKPDVICYNTLARSLDDLCRILEAGVNVVSTSRFVTGRRISPDAEARLAEACRTGRSSLHGTGLHPGLINSLALQVSGFCTRLYSVEFTESADVTDYDSVSQWEAVGWGKPPVEGNDMTELIKLGSSEAAEGIEAMADALGIELDEVGFENEFSVAQEDLALPYLSIDKGCVAGMRLIWYGTAYGRRVITINMVYRMRGKLDPPLETFEGYVMEIQGEPSMRMTLGWDDTKVPGVNRDPAFMASTLEAAAASVINSIPAVCNAEPGVRTFDELTPVVARHLVLER